MGLLHLVEQDDGVGTPTDGLGELAALVVPHVAGRRSDQPGDRVLLGVLTHVDADHRALVVEEEVGQGPGQLGLAGAGGAQEQEGSGRSVGVADAGPRAAYGVADGVDRRLLADQSLADDLLHLEQLGGLALEQTPGGDARPGLDDVGDLLGADLLADQRLDVGLLDLLGVLDLPLELGDPAVEDLAGLAQVTLALQTLGLDPELVELASQLPLPLQARLLALPPRLEATQLLLTVGELGPQSPRAVRRRHRPTPWPARTPPS